MKTIKDKDFHYISAEKSRKPGYLKARMAKYRLAVKQEAERPSADVITPASFMLRRGGK